jgi:tetratricopeptide (TPR) repeat protein
VPAPATVQEISETELMYHILLGELAARRGQFQAALGSYLIAARASNDPRIAERAANLALFVNDDEATLLLAQRWYQLAPNDVRARQAMAIALLRKQQVEQAVEHLEAVLAAASEDPQEGFATLSALLSQVKDQETVYQALSRLRERHPQSRYALYYHALAALRVEQYAPALASLQAALALDPQWREALLLRAQVKLQQGASAEALAELAQAVERAPQDRQLRLGYARLLVSAEKLSEARAQFETLAEQDPNDADSLYALGLLAAEAEQYDVAEDYLLRVLKLGQRIMDVYFELGKLAEQRKDYAKAREWYEQVADGERYLGAQVRAAAMLARQGDVSAMSTRMAELRLNNPDDAVSLYIAEADILREEKKYQPAFDVLSEALKSNPDNEDLLYARALAAERLDRLDVLEADLRKIITADPDNGHALNALGYTLADRTGRYEEALGYLERAIALLPDDAAVLDSMGWVNYRLGHYEEALRYLRRAYEINDDAEIVAHLSEVLWVAGHKGEAREIWRKALAKTPDSEHLRRVNERFKLDGTP